MGKASIVRVLVLIISVQLLSGCASIFCGSHKTVNIASEPPGASFEVINKRGKPVVNGVTPTNVSLKRGGGYFAAGDYAVTFRKDGYQEQVAPVPQGLETGWYLVGNFIFGGLIGYLVVDPLTGGMWNIHDVNVTLLPDPGHTEPTPATEAPQTTPAAAPRGYKAPIIR